jgi:hypothetical protein
VKRAMQKKAKVFDVDYASFINANEVKPRHQADDWRLYLDCLPLTQQMRKRLLLDIEAEIVSALKTGNGDFFRKFARYIEKPKDPCPRCTWLINLHDDGITFTHAELVEAARASGFYKKMDDENILRDLRRLMARLNFQFTNSPEENQPGGGQP